MIGNDIIDIEFAKRQSNWQRKGWLQKLFTETEQKIILGASVPSAIVWKFWSMKEATYKAHQRRFGLAPKFNPKDFGCFLNENKVIIDGCEYCTYTQITSQYIYTVSNLNPNNNYISQIFDFEIDKHDYLNKIFNHEYSVITITKNHHGVPVIYGDTEAVNIPVSFTDHGRYTAIAIGNFS